MLGREQQALLDFHLFGSQCFCFFFLFLHLTRTPISFAWTSFPSGIQQGTWQNAKALFPETQVLTENTPFLTLSGGLFLVPPMELFVLVIFLLITQLWKLRNLSCLSIWIVIIFKDCGLGQHICQALAKLQEKELHKLFASKFYLSQGKHDTNKLNTILHVYYVRFDLYTTA